MAIDILMMISALIVGFGIGMIANCRLIIGLIFSATGYRPFSETLSCKKTFIKQLSFVWGSLAIIVAVLVWLFGYSVGAVLLAGFILGSIYSALESLYNSTNEVK